MKVVDYNIEQPPGGKEKSKNSFWFLEKNMSKLEANDTHIKDDCEF